jgi:murein DD-endopeptidase MepM/ murein hydrolase activator NlpD
MRVVPLLIISTLLAGCKSVPSTPIVPHATETVSAALTEIRLPSDTPIASIPNIPEPKNITPLPIATPASCAPEINDYCVVDGHFIFNRPIVPPGNDDVESTYRYGSTQNSLREPHHGVEFPNPSGIPVLAAADGMVVFAGSDMDSLLSPWPNFYGNAVVIEHSFTGEITFTLYGHLSKVDVVPGEFVDAGGKIGEVGATGAAIGNHLHFEVRSYANDYGSTRNPELWLIPKPGYGALAVRVTGKKGDLLPVQLNIQKIFPDGSLQSIAQPEAYDFKEKIPVVSDEVYGENFALGDLVEGDYRLSFVLLGKLYERLIKIESGKLTLVEISIK